MTGYRRKNKIVASLLIILMLLSFLPAGVWASAGNSASTGIRGEEKTVAFAIDYTNYRIGGKEVKTDVAPYIKDGRTMVPVAFVAPALGTESAIWSENERTVTLKRGQDTIVIKIGSKELSINGKKMMMDVAAEIKDIGGGGGRTMLPIAFIARALEVGYQWIPANRTVEFYGYNEEYKLAGTFGPDLGTETIKGNVIVRKDGVKLQNLVIKGNLIIAEEVGQGDVYLNNVTVEGKTLVRGGGKDSIHITGGSYSNITIENVDGQVRIVATGVDGIPVVVAEGAAGEEVILEGSFDSVTVEGGNAKVTTQGNTIIGEIIVKDTASGSIIQLGSETQVGTAVLDGQVEIQGAGTITEAQVNADGVIFENPPEETKLSETVQTPPVTSSNQPSTTGGGGGGGAPAKPAMGGTVSIDGTVKFGEVLTANITGLTYTPVTNNDVPTYCWKRAGVDIVGATQNTYTLVDADIGQTITVTVTADDTNAAGSVTSGATAAVQKADGPVVPAAPVLDKKAHNNITLAANGDHEFSKDSGVTWQNNIFSGLNSGTAYTFIARVKETSTQQASEISNTTTITTEPTPLTWRKINALDSFPAGIVRGVDFYGDYLAAAHSMSPFVSIYKREGDTFKKLPQPADLPAGHGEGTAFSSTGNYLAVVHTYSPHLTIYKRTGDTFTKLPTPVGLPELRYPLTDGAYDVAFSNDDTYMAVAHKAGSSDKRYLTIFKRAGDTFTKLADPDVILTDPGTTGSGLSVDFSPDSSYLAVGHATSGDPASYLTIYSRVGDTFTKLDVADLPSGYVYGLGFSNAGSYLAAGHNSPYRTIYQRDGDVFTKLSDLGSSPGSLPWDIAFSLDDKYLAMALSNSPYLAFYVRYGNSFVKLDNPADLPTGQGQSIAFSQDGQYVATGYAGSNTFLNIYKTVDPTSTLKVITTTTVGTLEGGNITSVPAGTKVFDLKAGLTFSTNATVEILNGAGGAVVSNQTTTDVTAAMVVEVTAGDGSKAEYSISMEYIPSSDTVVTSKNNGESQAHYSVTIAQAGSQNEFIPANNPVTGGATAINTQTTVGEFLGNLNQPAGSSWKVFANENNPLAGDPPVDGVANFNAKPHKADGVALAENDLLFVLAEDGATLRGYHINVMPPPRPDEPTFNPQVGFGSIHIEIKDILDENGNPYGNGFSDFYALIDKDTSGLMFYKDAGGITEILLSFNELESAADIDFNTTTGVIDINGDIELNTEAFAQGGSFENFEVFQHDRASIRARKSDGSWDVTKSVAVPYLSFSTAQSENNLDITVNGNGAYGEGGLPAFLPSFDITELDGGATVSILNATDTVGNNYAAAKGNAVDIGKFGDEQIKAWYVLAEGQGEGVEFITGLTSTLNAGTDTFGISAARQEGTDVNAAITLYIMDSSIGTIQYEQVRLFGTGAGTDIVVSAISGSGNATTITSQGDPVHYTVTSHATLLDKNNNSIQAANTQITTATKVGQLLNNLDKANQYQVWKVTTAANVPASAAVFGPAPSKDPNSDLAVGDVLTVLSSDWTTIRSYAITVTGVEKTLTWGGGQFSEAAANDGSIDTVITVTLSNENFTGEVDAVFTSGNQYTAANVPAGLAVQITKKTATTAEISLTGNAANHALANSIANLTITFNDAAFAGGNASAVTDSSKNNLAVTFDDPEAAPGISGVVTYGVTPLEGIVVKCLTDPMQNTTTNANGYYAFPALPAGGGYAFLFEADYYYDDVADNLNKNAPGTFNKAMGPGAKITGSVSCPGHPVAGVKVKDVMNGTETVTDADGNYVLRGVLCNASNPHTIYLNFYNDAGNYQPQGGNLVEVVVNFGQTTDAGVTVLEYSEW